MAELSDFRLKVLQHIELHSAGGKYSCRVPDAWIEEANASVRDGQSIFIGGRKLTDAGRADLVAALSKASAPEGE